MPATRRISLSFLVLCLVVAAAPMPAVSQATRNGSSVMLEEYPVRDATLLDVVQRGLAVVVERGRFQTETGMTSTCVHARRSPRGQRQVAANVRTCRMMAAFVDGVRIGDAGSFLATARVRDFRSIELLGTAAAMQRYGLGAEGGEALDIRTRGSGPRAPR